MRKVIFTTYFTSKPNPQKTAKKAIPNNYDMIRGWYESVNALKMTGIIFHDHLFDSFIKTYAKSNIMFIYTPLLKRSTNDDRFYIYQMFLRKWLTIEWLLMTDLFDVDFLANPFDFMKDESKVYVGSEMQETKNFSVIENRAKQVWGKLPDWWEKVDKTPLNAGIIGGHRIMMLHVLSRMIGEMDAAPVEINFNMQAINKIIHGDNLPFVTGYPLHSAYKMYDKNGRFYIRHK